MKKLIVGTAAISLSLSFNAQAQSEVKLVGARSQQCYTSGCSFDPNLVGEIRVENIAYKKQVDVVFDSYFLNTWTAEPASYQGPASAGYEIWDFFIFDNVQAFALSYTVNGNTYWDNNSGADYTPATGPNTIAILGKGIDVLISEKLQFNTAGLNQDENNLLVYAWARNHNVDDATLSFTYTDDNWTTVKTAAATVIANEGGDEVLTFFANLPVDALANPADIEFAAEYRYGEVSVWDNNYGRNYRIDSENNISR